MFLSFLTSQEFAPLLPKQIQTKETSLFHNVSETDGDEEVDFTDLSLSYQLNDNCSLGYRSWKIDDVDYTFITVGIGL